MEPVTDYELKAFFSHVIDVLNRLEISYMVGIGFAAILYGEPRLTIDVDVVVNIKLGQVRSLVAAFPIPDYYASEESIRDSLQRRYPFNIIPPATGAKIDLVPLPGDPFSRLAFQRRQRLTYDEAGHSAMFIAAEDLLVAKLIAHQGTGSDKHLRDARGILMTQWGTLNLEAVRRNARASGVLEQWQDVLETARGEIEA